MKSIGIATDSYCGILEDEAEQLGIMILPMPFYIGGECFYENISISREQFWQYLASGKKVSTSQPAPNDVMELWKQRLEKHENIIYIPMSSGLSGSCSTAKMLAKEPVFEGRVFVVDNGRVSTPMHRAILDAVELVNEGYEAEQIKNMLEAARSDMTIYLVVETLQHLKDGGRISATTAAIGTVLNIKPVLKFDVGTLDTYRKCRGMKKARREMLEAIKSDFETTFQNQYEKGEIYLLAASSADEITTQEWVSEIQEYFPNTPVLHDELTLGLCCHTGKGVLGIGCSCRPHRENNIL